MMYRTNLITLVVILSGCAEPQIIVPPQYKVMITGDTLVYEGMITGNAVLEAVRLVRLSDKKVKKLRITSTGGDMAVGIEFGYFVRENNLDVEVSQLCFSSCANYVLPAANHIVIKADALLGWHGGAKQADELWEQNVPNNVRKDFFSYLDRLRVKETAFFEMVGVDQDITNYGHLRSDSCQKQEQTAGWFYSLNDLDHMGIKNIEIQSGELSTKIKYNSDDITSCLMPEIFKI
ncbi:hypothetical protein L3Q72_03045 [Vibrio sp. JC009]|uniref:hypothetical protein n=1 Tax=Vibrio sp. JC009 TaxID=2912314 RepID=UPI0023B1C730|nr:hypothetical protein [Vibrio sp. JC009]WED22396.1 hypothetical protein L3Q72_03045 [Vibrio sp. JC009]